MSRPSTLRVPKRDGSTGPEQQQDFASLKELESLVVVGANGSGKSRFGYAVEKANQKYNSVQRIAAQRALEVPQSVAPAGLEQARRAWYYGNKEENATDQQRETFRWGRKPITGLLNDYERLMQLVFAKTNERNHRFTKSHLDGTPMDEPPESPADKVERVWSTVLPHRTLSFKSSQIVAKTETTTYNATEMSDGERVALYLMASVFVAPKNSVLIIDEPEIHLHRSIRDTLFDRIEAERSDCLFIYLTHDIEFATSRPAATHIWLKEFTGSGWLWEHLVNANGLPNALTAEVLGSRRPILFVEGDLGSLDCLLYTATYKDWYVVPVGSCSRVIQFTKALNGADQLHHLTAKGVIDRDRRTDDEIATLTDSEVHVLPVAEIENILLLPDVLASLTELLDLGQNEIESTKELVLKRFKNQKSRQVREHTHYRIRTAVMAEIDASASSSEALGTALDNLSQKIDFPTVQRDLESLFDEVTSNADFVSALKLFNHKSLVRHVSKSIFGLNNRSSEDGLSNFVRRHLHSNSESSLVSALRSVLPTLSD